MKALIKTPALTILGKQRFNFGNRPIDQYILFEWKYLGGLMFFCFRKSENVQDRWHTHAFNSVSFKLCGSYEEHILENGQERIENRTNIVKFFERNIYHKIGRSSKDCWTFLVCGPWRSTWKEIKDKVEYELTWGRQNKYVK